MAAMCLVASLPSLVQAQVSSANAPAAVVALQKIKGQMDDIKFLATEAGYGDQAAIVPMMAQGYLQGVDMDKPMGVALWFEDQQPRVLGMIPVTDIDAILDQLSGFNIPIDEDGDFYFVETPNADIAITVQGGYAFLSDSKENLAGLPSDPAKLLSDIAASNILSAKVWVQRIPENLREMAVDQMRKGFESAMEDMDNGDLEELQREANAMQMQQLIDLVQNSDQLEIHFGTDADNKKLVFESSFTGLEGSKVAKQAAAMVGKSSRFGKFLVDSAAFNSNGFGVLLEEDKQNLTTLLDNLKATAMQGLEDESDMSDDERAVVTDLVDDVFALVNSTVDAGFIDVGATLMSDEGSMNLAIGGNLADADKFDSLVTKLTDLATSQQEVAIEAGETTVGGVSFQKLVVTLPDDVDDEVRQMFGDTITLMMGRKGEEAYFAAGTSPEETFETIMANSTGNSEYPVIYNVRIMPILRFVSSNPEAAPIAQQLMDAVDADNDRISIFSKVIENGQQVRGEMDSQILKLFGVIAMIGQQAQMGGGADF